MKEDELNDQELEEDDEIVTLIDEDGKEMQFFWAMSIEHNDETYAVLYPAEEIEGLDEDSAVIFQLSDDDENPAFLPVEDDETVDAVFEEYVRIVEAEEEDGEEKE